MQHIMQEKRATDAYAGPDHHYNDNVSYPSSGSLSPINCALRNLWNVSISIKGRGGMNEGRKGMGVMMMRMRMRMTKSPPKRERRARGGLQKKRNVSDDEDSPEIVISSLMGLLQEMVP